MNILLVVALNGIHLSEKKCEKIGDAIAVVIGNQKYDPNEVTFMEQLKVTKQWIIDCKKLSNK